MRDLYLAVLLVLNVARVLSIQELVDALVKHPVHSEPKLVSKHQGVNILLYKFSIVSLLDLLLFHSKVELIVHEQVSLCLQLHCQEQNGVKLAGEPSFCDTLLIHMNSCLCISELSFLLQNEINVLVEIALG